MTTSTVPVLQIRNFNGGSWCVHAEFPDGTFENVSGFKSENEANEWIAKDFQRWLDDHKDKHSKFLTAIVAIIHFATCQMAELRPFPAFDAMEYATTGVSYEPTRGDTMKRHNIVGLSAVVALGLALVVGGATAQQKTLKEQLVGGWTLVSQETIAADGTKAHPYGANPKGVAYYGADGRFFVLFANGDLPKIAANNRAKATPEEAKAIVAGTIAYSGTYTIDEPSKTIMLRVEATTFPNQSPNQKRVITSLTANEVKFTNPTATAGGRIEVTLKRAQAATN